MSLFLEITDTTRCLPDRRILNPKPQFLNTCVLRLTQAWAHYKKLAMFCNKLLNVSDMILRMISCRDYIRSQGVQRTLD